MAPHARDGKISRRNWLLAGLALSLFSARAADTISVAYDGDTLRPVAPNVHFLAGKSLDHLKDGETVTFYSRLSLFAVNRSDPVREAGNSFVVSYDLWEQNFKVTIPGPAKRSRTGLTGPQAESWCLENMTIGSAGLAQDTLFFLRLELRGERQKEPSGPVADSGAGISIRPWIDLFIRKAGPDDPHLGPFESARQRRRLVDQILSGDDRKLVTVTDAALSPEILRETWCAVTVESTVAFECAAVGIPAFLCGWLRHAYAGYASQYAAFGVGRMLESPEELLRIPDMLRETLPGPETARQLVQGISPKSLSELLCHLDPAQANRS